jgi:transposase
MNGPRRARYPSDLSQLQWLCLERILPQSTSKRGRKKTTDLRAIANAINYRWTTGCVWRMLPHDYPPWETVYTYFREWRALGLLNRMREIMIHKNYPLKVYAPKADPQQETLPIRRDMDSSANLDWKTDSHDSQSYADTLGIDSQFTDSHFMLRVSMPEESRVI